MAITIDTITLPQDLVVDTELGYSTVRADVRLSLGGAPIIFEQTVGGQYIDLVGDSQRGWISREDLVDLRALAQVPYATYTLVYETETKTVRFRHEDQPVIEAEPIIPRPNADDADWYNNVRIKLMEM